MSAFPDKASDWTRFGYFVSGGSPPNTASSYNIEAAGSLGKRRRAMTFPTRV